MSHVCESCLLSVCEAYVLSCLMSGPLYKHVSYLLVRVEHVSCLSLYGVSCVCMSVWNMSHVLDSVCVKHVLCFVCLWSKNHVSSYGCLWILHLVCNCGACLISEALTYISSKVDVRESSLCIDGHKGTEVDVQKSTSSISRSSNSASSKF